MFGLKRFRVRSRYHPIIRPIINRVFRDCDKIIIQQQFTTSPKDFLMLCEVFWKKGIKDHGNKLEELGRDIEWVDEIITISTYENRTLGFLKGKYHEQYTALFTYTTQEFMCFVEFPIVGTLEYGEGHLVGPPKEVDRMLDFLKAWGSALEIRAVTEYNTKDKGILTALTDRQLEILKAAYEEGFFDLPRKKDARDVAYKLGMAHTTFLTHIRKAQRKIIATLLEE